MMVSGQVKSIDQQLDTPRGKQNQSFPDLILTRMSHILLSHLPSTSGRQLPKECTFRLAPFVVARPNIRLFCARFTFALMIDEGTRPFSTVTVLSMQQGQMVSYGLQSLSPYCAAQPSHGYRGTLSDQ